MKKSGALRALALSALTAAFAFSATAPALAAKCQPAGGFGAFIAEFKREAVAQGISARGLSALDNLTLDEKVLASDKRQGVFNQSFEQFSGRMISRDRMTKGTNQLLRHASMLQRVEEQFGVPASVVVAIWGLETDYGVNQGKLPVVRSVASLAYDCRRSEKFQGELMDALRIIDRGDMTADEMRGDWAGEIGQTQFLPSSYYRYAVDFDGNGRRDLIHSVPDVLASTANYLKGKGWQRGQGWQPGQPNFQVIKEWNKADVYARTIAAFAERLDANTPRAAEMTPGPPPRPRR